MKHYRQQISIVLRCAKPPTIAIHVENMLKEMALVDGANRDIKLLLDGRIELHTYVERG